MSRTAILNFIAAKEDGALTYAMNFCRELAPPDGWGGHCVAVLGPEPPVWRVLSQHKRDVT